MTENAAVSGPAPVRVGLGRSNVVVALAVLGFLGWIVWAGGHGAYTADSTSARVLGYGIAALFAVPLVMMLRALPRFLSPRQVIVDAESLRIQHGREQVVLPWSELAAVGIGYQRAPDEPAPMPTTEDEAKEAVQDFLSERAHEALQVSGKRRIALEIFPVRPEAVDAFPRLKPYWQRQPPAAGLPALWWRFPLPPVDSIARQIATGIQATRPDRWVGWQPRDWSEPGK